MMGDSIYKEVSDLFFQENRQNDIHLAFDYLKKMFDYNLIGGKGTRGKTVMNTYRYLDRNETKLKQAEVAGCCIEILQASFLIHDDIMDNSELRRQKTCWYLKAKEMGYGLIAVNDGLFLNTIMFKILAKYFRTESYFPDLICLFNETIYKTCSGQCLDMLTSSETIDLSIFSKERYEAIVKWKTAYYSFYLPVMCGMIIAEIKDEALFNKAEIILLKIGEYFQIQDDFLDCYGDPKVLGKIGRDIEEGKCSWLIVQALSKVDDMKRKQLEENYGKDNAQSVKKVKEIFNEIGLKQLYHEYEDKTYEEVSKMINNLVDEDTKSVPLDIFVDLLNVLYKRVK